MPASVRAPPSENPAARNLAVEQLRSLQKQYTFADDGHKLLEAFEDDLGLYPLLTEAVKPLRRSFGDGSILQIRTPTTDEGIVLKAVIQLPTDFEGAEKALCAFDQNWWLNNCQRSEALLIFDYEISDGV